MYQRIYLFRKKSNTCLRRLEVTSKEDHLFLVGSTLCTVTSTLSQVQTGQRQERLLVPKWIKPFQLVDQPVVLVDSQKLVGAQMIRKLLWMLD